MDKTKKPVETLTSLRAGILELAVTAVILGLGVNLVASGIPLALGLEGWTTTVLGVVACAVGAVYLFVRLRPANARRFEFKGVVLLSKNEDRGVVPVQGYEFTEHASRYFRGLCVENKALAKQWRESPIGPVIDMKAGTVDLKNSPAHELMREALEYFVLDRLSTHLTDYFDSIGDGADKRTQRLERQHIPDVLLSNRFLEAFSRPMGEREVFLDHNSNTGRVVYAVGRDGAVFSEFELILPRGAKVLRSPSSGLRIVTPRFSCEIDTNFGGFGANLPRKFEDLYLGKTGVKTTAYDVSVTIDVSFKLQSLFSVGGRQYYQWLDLFLDEFEKLFSFEKFLEEIGWPIAVSVAIATVNLRENLEKNQNDLDHVE